MKGVHKGIDVFSIEEAKEIFPSYFEGRETEAKRFIFLPKNFQASEMWKITEPESVEIYLSKGASLQLWIDPIIDGAFEVHAHLEEGAFFSRFYAGEKKNLITLKSRYMLKKGAKLLHFSWTEAVERTEESILATIEGEGAEVDLVGGWHLIDRERIGVNVVVEHRAPCARSNQLFKGVVEESARSSFEGSIYVAKGADKTESFQRNNNCVFGAAQAKTAPGIKVFHDDVKASHGATIAKPSKEDLFYLVSRGVNETRAKELLIQAFLAEVQNFGAPIWKL
ncbi:MAG: SufB/SufD family protein [Chlamydiia bacterium]